MEPSIELRKREREKEREMSSVKVAVRVRPFNKRELDHDAINIVKVSDQTTAIANPRSPDDIKSFTYDYSYNSFDPSDKTFANQERNLNID